MWLMLLASLLATGCRTALAAAAIGTAGPGAIAPDHDVTQEL